MTVLMSKGLLAGLGTSVNMEPYKCYSFPKGKYELLRAFTLFWI